MFKLTYVLFIAAAVLAGPDATAVSLKVSNRAASIMEIGYLPVSGSTVAANPPALGWLGEKGATSWTIEIARDAEFVRPVVSVSDWPWLLYTHTEPLEPAEYHWRYRFSDKKGKLSGWSQTRSFVVPADATEFPRPSAEDLAARIPAAHPRMYMTPGKLSELRESADLSDPLVKRLVASATASLKAPLMKEPKKWTGGKWNVEEWRAYMGQAGTATHRMQGLAFAWVLTKNAEFGARAREHLLNFAAWDPAGPSSMKINDEVGMPVLFSVSRTYDWIHPLLSEEDKSLVREHIRARGEETYKRIRTKPYDQFVFNSHFGRMWHFLGEAGVSFYGEIPEAEKWLNYAMTIFYGWYPYWGDSDGGWAEGIHYWTSYNTFVITWLDLMIGTLGIDGSQKPFYANVADFPMFVVPPGNPVAGFGDFSERPVQSSSMSNAVAKFAQLRGDTDWQWYAEQSGGSADGGALGYLRSLREKPKARKPEGLPLVKVFQKSGIAAFNTDITDPKNNFHMAMRCSEFGNVSHSHNDQNAIVMAAYGEPLLVNTGRRDFYNSPFCKAFYWHTLSHNAVLINGEGQKRGQATTGTIFSHGMRGEDLAWAVGDATNAYPDLAKLYRRWTIFLPDYGAVLVDEIETTASEVSLLFHGRAAFDIASGEQGQGFGLTKGKAKLSGLVYAADARTTQSDEYPLPMHKGIEPFFDEWHLRVDVPLSGEAGSAGSRSGAGEVVFLNGRYYIVSFLEVDRASEADGGKVGGGADSRYFVSGLGSQLRISKQQGSERVLELSLDLEKGQVLRKN